MPDHPIPVLLLFGPTASGKTALLERLFVQDLPAYQAEIVSADSMQVYRGMDIGTAKPPLELRAVLPHHLIDIRDPNEQFNAGEFVRLADACCRDIAKRGGLPVISGGTGFYLKNFVLGLPDAPPSDAGIRQELKEELRCRGIATLAEELAACDPQSAGRIHINDTYRLLRALEVFRVSGRPLSSFSSTSGPRPDYRLLIMALDRPREELYRRIDERCALMFQAGLPTEVQRLHDAGFGPRDPGLRAIGYKEFFVEPEPGHYHLSEDLASVETLVARNSRRYAKRQMTYFASIPGVTWIPAARDPVAHIKAQLKEVLPSIEP
ncbi:MAG: tRNA (adenosine(37)-N6)-dimethylallyltransferase MiaA [Treponema sp.]|jgi:tRNA dimethylallyltransferase|nr:tRNA (adenosine(37)-N6)-dimethylallyltransferase MiaA [Treponema sp.]